MEEQITLSTGTWSQAWVRLLMSENEEHTLRSTSAHREVLLERVLSVFSKVALSV
jgi:hypothetical protein